MSNSSPIKQQLSLPENVKLVAKLLLADPNSSRRSLARQVCQHLDLKDSKGDWQMATTSRALRELHDQSILTLPKARSLGPGSWNPTRLHQPVAAPEGVPEVLQEIRGLCLIEVVDEEQGRIWNELMLGEHYLKECRLVGRQLRYLIGSDHGWLGGIGFGSAALHLEGRDDWIGWTPEQRIENLERVLNMSRFLIRPSVVCPNLASHVLGLCARRVAGDFERRYGVRPWLLESFVETPAYEGTCYRAANWIQTGQTKGRGRNGPHKAGQSIKDIYMYALVNDFRDRAGVKPVPIEALAPESGLDAADWTGQEFGNCQLGDERLVNRLVKIASVKATQPQGSYAQANGGQRHDLKGYYRFLNNERPEITEESMLQSHRGQTIRRMKNEQVALIVQDTTDLNLSTRSHCEGLGQIGTNQTGAKSRGLRLHSSLALGQEGLPLGLIQLHGYAPESAEGKDPGRPTQEKESYRWLEGFAEAMKIAELLPDTQIINVADREADMFELFDFRRRQSGRKAELLIRAKSDRCLEETERKLFAELTATPLAGTVSITVPRQREHLSKPSTPGRPGLPLRQAQVEIRFKQVTLSAPNTAQTRNLNPITLWAIYLLEKDPPVGATQLEWMLLTTIQVTSVKQALKCIGWYCRRWRIEEWHRVLKSGCNILDHQNQTAEALLRAIAIDAVIAWRIMLLSLLGREVPELPCDILFDRYECRVLELLSKKKTESKLSLGEAITLIARLGGYLNRKCDGPPGFETLWKGYTRFSGMAEILRLQEAADLKNR